MQVRPHTDWYHVSMGARKPCRSRRLRKSLCFHDLTWDLVARLCNRWAAHVWQHLFLVAVRAAVGHGRTETNARRRGDPGHVRWLRSAVQPGGRFWLEIEGRHKCFRGDGRLLHVLRPPLRGRRHCRAVRSDIDLLKALDQQNVHGSQCSAADVGVVDFTTCDH